MLEGKNVNLRVVEKEDLPLFAEWWNNLEVAGEYVPLRQDRRTEIEKRCDDPNSENKFFIMEKKDGSKIGFVGHFPTAEKLLEIGFVLIPSERGKGYCTEAAKIMVDYLFLSRDVVRIQAQADTRNITSQKVLESSDFKREGVVRNKLGSRGEELLNPLPEAQLSKFLKEAKKVLVPELNYTSQFANLLRARLGIDAISLAKTEGLPFTPDEILRKIEEGA